MSVGIPTGEATIQPRTARSLCVAMRIASLIGLRARCVVWASVSNNNFCYKESQVELETTVRIKKKTAERLRDHCRKDGRFVGYFVDKAVNEALDRVKDNGKKKQ